jgi:acetyltransferase-like isoleucine patch superfamily enzyme
MQAVIKMFSRLLTKLYLLKLVLMCKLFGIDYLLQAISQCPKHFIVLLLTKYGASIGTNVSFKENLYIDNTENNKDPAEYLSNLSIGNRCYIGKGVFFDLPEHIYIEDECAISAGVKFITHSDCGNRIMSRWYPRRQGKITIGSGSWIGVNAVILSDVVLGRCCVVAAGSVVTKSFPNFSVIAGIPAKVVKTLEYREDESQPS